MKRILILFILFSILSCKPKERHSQITIAANPSFYSEDPAYTQLVKELLSSFQFRKHHDEKIWLVDVPIKLNNLSNFLKDSTSFFPFEINHIINHAEYLSQIKFKNNLGEKVNIVPLDTIKSIFKTRSKKWNYFEKNYGESFLQISHPIFVQNNTRCILYLNYSCGERCGEEQIRLYQKINNQWVCIKTGYGWIS